MCKELKFNAREAMLTFATMPRQSICENKERKSREL